VAVRIVTDSSADLPSTTAEQLGITVVPLHIYFGEQVFRDGVDLQSEEFYHRLTHPGRHFPRTAAPSSGDFAAVYREVARDADGIVSLHLSAKLSGTFHAAAVGMTQSSIRCPVDLVDTTTASLGLGLLVIQAAELAQAGAPVEDIVRITADSIPRVRFFGALDTLEYLHRGGRIGRASALLGSVLQVKPIVGLLDGVAYPIERVRGRHHVLRRVSALVSECSPIERVAVGHTTDREGMEALATHVGSLAPHLPVLRARCGATLGTYLGPGAFGAGLILAPSGHSAAPRL